MFLGLCALPSGKSSLLLERSSLPVVLCVGLKPDGFPLSSLAGSVVSSLFSSYSGSHVDVASDDKTQSNSEVPRPLALTFFYPSCTVVP